MKPQPKLDLVDHHGRAVTMQSFAGRRCVVFFGFTHCQVVCPRALDKLSAALDDAGSDAADIVGLYVTVDPERDTVERLAEFLRPHPRFLGLTGSEAQTSAAREAFGVAVRRREDPDDPAGYTLPHSALTYLVGPEGDYEDHWLDSTTKQEVVDRLRRPPGLRHLELGSPN